jgi:hypothetical protein
MESKTGELSGFLFRAARVEPGGWTKPLVGPSGVESRDGVPTTIKIGQMVRVRAPQHDLTPFDLVPNVCLSNCDGKEVIEYEKISSDSDDCDHLDVVSRFSRPEHGRD